MKWPDGREVTPAEADALGFLGVTPEMHAEADAWYEANMSTLTLDGGTPQPLPQVVSDPGDELPKLPPGPIPPPVPRPPLEENPQVIDPPPVPVPTVPDEQ